MNALRKSAIKFSGSIGFNIPKCSYLLENNTTLSGINLTRWIHHAWLKDDTFNDIDEIVKKLVLGMAIGSERGVSLLGLHALHAFYQLSKFREEYSHNELVEELKRLTRSTHEISINNVFSILDSYRLTEFSKKILGICISHVGSGIRLKIDDYPSSANCLILKNGYTFPIRAPDYITTNEKRIKKDDCVIVTIDGIIERVSELERLVLFISGIDKCCLLFARGMHSDVISTLKENYLRGNLDIIPMIIPITEVGNAIFYDIADIGGGISIDPALGNTISCFDPGRLKSQGALEIDKEGITFLNNTVPPTFTKELSADNRISSKQLFWRDGKYCLITLKDCNQWSLRKDEIEIGLKSIKAAVRYGVLDVRESLEHCEHKAISCILHNLIENNIDLVIADYFFKGVIRASSCLSLINRCKYVIRC